MKCRKRRKKFICVRFYAMPIALPSFRFHTDPLASGSVLPSDTPCEVCGQARGFIYTGPVYSEGDAEAVLCPWCIADGSAHRTLDAIFHDTSFPDGTSEEVMAEIEERTPGFAVFNPFEWPCCCGLPMAYVEPAGIAEIRARHYTLEGSLMGTIVHDFGISGGAARTFMEYLRRDESPCVQVFHCLTCDTVHGHIDRT